MSETVTALTDKWEGMDIGNDLGKGKPGRFIFIDTDPSILSQLYKQKGQPPDVGVGLK